MRIVYMGTAEFGIPTLRTLHRHHEVRAVVTSVDSQRGRGRIKLPSPVKTAARDLGIDVLEQANLSDPEFHARLRKYDADLFFVVAFRILPPDVFTIPPQGTVNLHASLLPDYRGAAPINRAIINGEKETGLTTFYIKESVDTGDILRQEKIPIGPDETAGELAARMMELGADISLKTVGLIETGEAHIVQQPLTTAKKAPKLYKSDGLIDWSQDARTIHNKVRGMNPAPGAYTQTNMGALKIHRTEIVDEDTPGIPGSVNRDLTKKDFIISCGRGNLKIVEIQPPGKKSMGGRSFINGYQVKNNMIITDLA